ncbi:MAG TPA: hypothetical protein DD791_08090 [Syntrophomonas sp.]|nr:hypothetical protein [Syntrophomonas sp.]
MKLLDTYCCADVCLGELPREIEERLLIEAYREMPRSRQIENLGFILYQLEKRPKEKHKRGLTLVK